MQLNDLAARIQEGGHLRDLLVEIINIGLTLGMIGGDHRGTAAEPAKRFTKRNVKIERKIALGLIVLEDELR